VEISHTGCEPDKEAVDFMEHKVANLSACFFSDCPLSMQKFYFGNLAPKAACAAGWLKKSALFCRLYLAFDIAT
jgi:hypothetical protein